MILTCQRCLTSYRLEESLVSEAGTKVRCSSCGYIFFAYPPGHYPDGPAEGDADGADRGIAATAVAATAGAAIAGAATAALAGGDEPLPEEDAPAAASIGKTADELDFLQDTTTELEAPLADVLEEAPEEDVLTGREELAADEIEDLIEFNDDPLAEAAVEREAADELSVEDLGDDDIDSLLDFGPESDGDLVAEPLKDDASAGLLEDGDGLFDDDELGSDDIEDLIDFDEVAQDTERPPEAPAIDAAVAEALDAEEIEAEELDVEEIEDLIDFEDDTDETPSMEADGGADPVADGLDELGDLDLLMADDGVSGPEENLEETVDLDMDQILSAEDGVEGLGMADSLSDELDLADIEAALETDEEADGAPSSSGGDDDLDLGDLDFGDLGLDDEGETPTSVGDAGGGDDADELDLSDLDDLMLEDGADDDAAGGGEGDSLDLDLGDLDLGDLEAAEGMDAAVASDDAASEELSLDLDLESGDEEENLPPQEISVAGIEEVLELDENPDDEALTDVDGMQLELDLDEEMGEQTAELHVDSQDLDIGEIEDLLDIKEDTTREQTGEDGFQADIGDSIDIADIESALDLSTEEETAETQDEELSLDMAMAGESEAATGGSGPITEELDLSDIEKMLDLETGEDDSGAEEAEAAPPVEGGDGDELELDLDFDMEMEPVSVSHTGENATAPGTDTQELDLSDMDEMFELADEPQDGMDSLDMDLELDLSLDVETEDNEELVGLPLSEDTAELDLSGFEDDAAMGVSESDDEELFDTTDFGIEYEVDESGADPTLPRPGEAGSEEDYEGTLDISAPDAMAQTKPETVSPAMAAAETPPPIKAPKKGLGGVVKLLLAVVLLGGAAVGAYVALDTFDIRIPFVSDFLGKEAAETGSLQLDGVTNRFVENSAAGKLFVISGKVRNDFNNSRRSIRLVGKLLLKGGQVDRNEWCYAGNTLPDIDLGSKAFADIGAQLKKRNPLTVAPGKTVPFMVVFDRLPADMEAYEIEVANSLAVKK